MKGFSVQGLGFRVMSSGLEGAGIAVEPGFTKASESELGFVCPFGVW